MSRYYVHLPDFDKGWEEISAQLFCDYFAAMRDADLTGLNGVRLASVHVGPIRPQGGDLDGILTPAELEAFERGEQ